MCLVNSQLVEIFSDTLCKLYTYMRIFQNHITIKLYYVLYVLQNSHLNKL